MQKYIRYIRTRKEGWSSRRDRTAQFVRSLRRNQMSAVIEECGRASFEKAPNTTDKWNNDGILQLEQGHTSTQMVAQSDLLQCYYKVTRILLIRRGICKSYFHSNWAELLRKSVTYETMCRCLLNNVATRAVIGLFKWLTEYEIWIVSDIYLLRFLQTSRVASIFCEFVS